MEKVKKIGLIQNLTEIKDQSKYYISVIITDTLKNSLQISKSYT